MTTSQNFDLCVIGAGPGGYVAAIRAAQLGLKVCVIEDKHLGGICLNWGCIPTKALLRSSEIHHLLHNLDQFGLSAKEIKFDFNKIIQRSRDVSKQLSGGIAMLLKKNKVEVIDGFGKITAKNQVTVSKGNAQIAKITAKNIILATGARARNIPGMESDGNLIWSYREAMTPKSLPKSILVVGSGAIGVEFASFYKNMGVGVTIVEMADRIVPVEDEEISKLALRSFKKQGMIIHTSAALKSIKKAKDSITATIEIKGKSQEIKAERVIMAVGIIPNVENIGLDQTRIKLDRGHIVTNGFLETDEEDVYALGDITQGPWLAHKASHEGIIAAEKIAEKQGKYDASNTHPIKRENIPGCTYCMPQIASVGLTEAKAKELGKKIKVGRFQNAGNGKAIAMGETEGLIKTIFDEETGELLGAHLIGAEVTEMIQGYVIGKQAELTELDFMHTIFPHPTMSEMMHESVLDAYNQAIHS